MTGWSSGVEKVVFRQRMAVSWWSLVETSGLGAELFVKVLKRAVLVALTCLFVLGGALVGCITGAITGQTTETGFFRGAGVGIISGAVLALELLDSVIDGQFLSKVAIFGSLINGKVFREWVSPAILKAYIAQASILEASYVDVSDIYDIGGSRGLFPHHIENIPKFIFQCNKTMDPCKEINCTICLQDFKEGEFGRRLPNCKHIYHLLCLDEWLVRNGSCPVCRQELLLMPKCT